MATQVFLQEFSKNELIFDENETREILKFIFRSESAAIDKLAITDRIRGFAQGLLIEAVDASYAMGFVEALFRAASNPGAGVKKVLKKFGKKALKHWFKHATAKDLMDIKIYETVRRQLELNFKTTFKLILSGLAKAGKFNAVLAYDTQTSSDSTVWG